MRHVRLKCGALVDLEDAWSVISLGTGWYVPKSGGWKGYAIRSAERALQEHGPMKPEDVKLPLFAHERLMFGRLARWIIEACKPLLPKPRVIYGRDGETPYLSRYYVLGGKPMMPDASSPFDDRGNPKREAAWPEGPFQLYLHRFHRSDEGHELHDHPFAWSYSLVLSGGYKEERLSDDFRKDDKGETPILRHAVLPLGINIIHGDTFHRVDLIERDAWTLFLVGPRVSSWGFYDRYLRTFTPWREHLARSQARAAWDGWTDEDRAAERAAGGSAANGGKLDISPKAYADRQNRMLRANAPKRRS